MKFLLIPSLFLASSIFATVVTKYTNEYKQNGTAITEIKKRGSDIYEKNVTDRLKLTEERWDNSTKTPFYSKSETEYMDASKTLLKSKQFKTTFYQGETKCRLTSQDTADCFIHSSDVSNPPKDPIYLKKSYRKCTPSTGRDFQWVLTADYVLNKAGKVQLQNKHTHDKECRLIKTEEDINLSFRTQMTWDYDESPDGTTRKTYKYIDSSGKISAQNEGTFNPKTLKYTFKNVLGLRRWIEQGEYLDATQELYKTQKVESDQQNSEESSCNFVNGNNTLAKCNRTLDFFGMDKLYIESEHMLCTPAHGGKKSWKETSKEISKAKLIGSVVNKYDAECRLIEMVHTDYSK